MSENLEEYTKKVIEEFEVISKDAERVQREVLKSILEENASAEYLQSLGLNGRTDPESFKECVPLVTHPDLVPYIQRILDGDKSSILTGKPITAMSLSSGTTQGKSKYIPWNETYMDGLKEMFHISFAYRNREFPLKNGRALNFAYASKKSETKEGITIGTASAHVFRNKKYVQVMSAINSQSCSPPEVTTGGIYNESLYCYLLCALIHREEIQVVSSTFAHSILQAFRTFEDVWEKLCNDIREGVLSSKITVPSVRTAVSEILKPDPELADLIHKKVSGLNNWYGLIPELFPNVKYVLSIMTGSMETYVERLRHYAGEVPLVSSDYGASEGSIGTNLHPRAPPELVSYTILPHLAYFEFIPLTENSSEDPKPVGLTEVKVGEEYELVMTTNAGFYRYRMGDVVKITGFYNSTPEFKFIRRRSIILSINIDKNTEHDLHLAVLEASKVLAKEKLYVVDYTSHADISELPGHYVIFFEISGEASEEVLSESCTSLEKHFLIEPGYMTSLKTNNIGPLELRVVRSGTFQKILDHFVGKGISVTQFKTPRCVAATNIILQILNENVEKKYISTALG